jgi:alkylated DNA nucleotide flippase Atl1/AcrR family transcriptional regulator
MRSRAAVLARSVQLASLYGLEGLTIGDLAADLGLPKSSVHSLFGSKEDLQLATLAAVRELLIELVVAPSLSNDEGLPRLQAIGQAWFDYLSGETFAGGCFLCSASAEMDGRPGPVRDAVAATMREWLTLLERNIDAAKGAGKFGHDVDPRAVAFRLNALGMAANWQRQLLGDPSGVDHARSAWSDELDRCTTRPNVGRGAASMSSRTVPIGIDHPGRGSRGSREGRIIERIKAIPEGFVRTYGDIDPTAPRLVGRILATTQEDLPWYRVVRADGSVPKGRDQLERLHKEGVPIRGDRVDLARARIPN